MFYITNHGTESISKDFVKQVELFFESSKAVKNSVRRQANNSRGFADDEFTKQKIDTKEIFDVGHKPNPFLPDDAIENRMLDGYNQWPIGENLENFRLVVENYYLVYYYYYDYFVYYYFNYHYFECYYFAYYYFRQIILIVVWTVAIIWRDF